MEEQKETNKVLQRMLEIMAQNEARIQTKELTSESEGLIDKAEKEGEEATKKLQTTFDRIHDKLFPRWCAIASRSES